MNGRIYTCGGCDRQGAVDVDATGYECPVCRFAWEFKDMRRRSAFNTCARILGYPRRPKPAVIVRDPVPLSKQPKLREDMRSRWKREYRKQRMFARHVREWNR